MLTDLLARMDFDEPTPPAVGVSACLLGDPVRYDGADKYHAPVAELAHWLELTRYCPEVGIGLSVPRPPIEIIRVDGTERVRGVEEPERDCTDALHGYAGRIDPGIDGFVFKARSPSCGWNTTPVFDRHGNAAGTTSGLFNQGLRERRPTLPFCDEEDLRNPRARTAFVLRVWTHRDLRTRPGMASELQARAQGLAPEPAAAVREQLALGAT